MCPRNLALHHPAADLLLDYATNGCPTLTGSPWTIAQMQTAIDRGPHVSALVPEAMAQLDLEVRDKVANGQARIVAWDTISRCPPPQLKVSPIAMVPHKSRPYRAILDLSFPVKLTPTSSLPSVNSNTTKTAPRAAIAQLGHSLSRIIHAFASASNDEKIFMAKWDIKDGFWRLDCAAGEEWNFAYVLPSSKPGHPLLVVPTSLQMGWIESPPYFCAASETARDCAQAYSDTKLGSHQPHRALKYSTTSSSYDELPVTSPNSAFNYLMEVFVDDFIALAVPLSQQHLDHVANSVLYGIHDVFPPEDTEGMDPISHKKLLKGDGEWQCVKEILGITFDGTSKTVWLSTEKRDQILLKLKEWIRGSKQRRGIPFREFQSTMARIQHAFITIPAGKGLLSPFYSLLAAHPKMVYLHRNAPLLNAITDCRTFLRESISSPT